MTSAWKCEACFYCWATASFTGWFWPVPLCCPERLYPDAYLELNGQSLRFNYAENDICCNISKTSKNLPLTSLKSVEVRTGCCVNCCTSDIKQVRGSCATAAVCRPTPAFELVRP